MNKIHEKEITRAKQIQNKRLNFISNQRSTNKRGLLLNYFTLSYYYVF